MKKLLLLSILCLFSIQSYSIELEPNHLKKIKVVKNWEPVADFEALKESASLIPIDELWTMYNNALNCPERLANVDPYPTLEAISTLPPIYSRINMNLTKAWGWCAGYVKGWANNGKPQMLGDILLSWASATEDLMIFKPTTRTNSPNNGGYQVPSLLGSFAQSYAIWYDEIDYTPNERKRVDSYLTNKLMEQVYAPLNYGYKPCDININVDIENISALSESSGWGWNNCGNMRRRVSMGEIMLGLRLEDQKLLDKGHDDLYFVQAFYNQDGIDTNVAMRGGKNINYYWSASKDLSLLVEIYDSVGYDYLEHTFPRGAKVHEYLSFTYKLMKDFKLTAPWARYDVGSIAVPYAPIKDLTQEQFQIVDVNNGRYAYRDGDKEFVKAHTKFVKRYMPNVYINGVKDYKVIVNNMSYQQGSGRAIYPYALHYANNAKEENAKAEKQKTGIEHWSDSSVCSWFKASLGKEAAPRIEVKNRGISCN
jgi:hypothetical protein